MFIIKMDKEDIDELRADMNAEQARKTQKAAEVASKVKRNREDIANFVIDMKLGWFINTQRKVRAGKIHCYDQISRLKEQIRQMEEEIEHMDNVDRCSKTLHEELLSQNTKIDNIHEKIIRLQRGLD